MPDIYIYIYVLYIFFAKNNKEKFKNNYLFFTYFSIISCLCKNYYSFFNICIVLRRQWLINFHP